METIDMAALPDDVLAGVLRVLPPRSLAVARCVCMAWHDMIDARELLQPHLLPSSVRGIFINYIDHERGHLFSRPSTSPKVDGLLSFLPCPDKYYDGWIVRDHCNGLLLVQLEKNNELCVCNPATRRWTLLPDPSGRYGSAYLAFDPAVSPHYKVFLIPVVRVRDDQYGSTLTDQWPLTPWRTHMFSSTTGEWEDRSFVRQGEAPGTTVEYLLDRLKNAWLGPRRQDCATYWRAKLYVHCQEGSFVTRFSLSNNMYQVIRTPSTLINSYLGTSKNGVVFGAGTEDNLSIWILNESGDERMEWSLKYQCDLKPQPYRCPRNLVCNDAWKVVEENHHPSPNDEDTGTETRQKGSFEWNSDNDDTIKVETMDKNQFCARFDEILGFHLYKDVVFLRLDCYGVMAYHLNSSKIQFLGYACPNCHILNAHGIYESFVYTPCLIGELDEDDTGLSN